MRTSARHSLHFRTRILGLGAFHNRLLRVHPVIEITSFGKEGNITDRQVRRIWGAGHARWSPRRPVGVGLITYSRRMSGA